MPFYIVIGKKGITGKVLTVIIGLVIALVSLYILWNFLMKSMPFISNTVTALITGFKEMVCSGLIPPFDWMCRIVLGVW